MGFAIADVDFSLTIDKDAVGPGGGAGEGVAIRSIAALAGAQHGLQGARFEVDAADGVGLGVGEVEAAVG